MMVARVERDNHVAGTQSRFIGRSVSAHALDEDALRVGDAELLRGKRGERCDLHVADRTSPHFAVLGQVVHDPSGEIAGHREADALVAAALG